MCVIPSTKIKMYEVRTYLIPFYKETGIFGTYESKLMANKRFKQLTGKLKYEVFHINEIKIINVRGHKIKYVKIVL